MASESASETHRSFERFLLFTDAIMAIAVTLLILPVVDSVNEPEYRDTSVMDLLRDHKGELFGFLLSFAVIVVLWLGHQQVFARVQRPGRPLMAIGVIWLLSITFLPFTTALIADHGDEQATVLLYVGNVAVSIYCLAASTWVLKRHPEFLQPGAAVTADDQRGMALDAFLVTAAFVFAALLPGLGFTVMLLLLLDGPIERIRARIGVGRAR